MSKDNIELIERAYAAFSRGDIAAVLQLFADRLEHFEVVSDGPWKAPWHVPARTRDEVMGYFQKLIAELEPLKFEYEHIAAGGDFVYATTYQQFRVRRNDRVLALRGSMHRFKIANGRIVGWLAGEDTLRTREALEG